MTSTQDIYTYIISLDDNKPVTLKPQKVTALKTLLGELRAEIIERMNNEDRLAVQRDKYKARLLEWEEE